MTKCEVAVILTCFNRREKTTCCMRSLTEGNTEAIFHFIIVDDNSTDGTETAVKSLGYDLHYIKGTGSLYWAGGMRKGIEHFLNAKYLQNCDYVLLVNDDVSFYDKSIDNMIAQAQGMPSAAIVGNCCDSVGVLSYGAIKFYKNKWKKFYYHLDIANAHINADTFNCNCVLLPAWMIRKVGNFDKCYIHSFADYDYGVSVRRSGFDIYGTNFYVGACSDNDLHGTWQDPSLPMKLRLKKKEEPKGLPFREHFHFLRKNLGLIWALRYVFTPYIRIMLGK